jgi:hypothetical protein
MNVVLFVLNLFQSILQNDQLSGRNELNEIPTVESRFKNVDRNFSESFRIEFVEKLSPLVVDRHRTEQLVFVVVQLLRAVVVILKIYLPC